MKQKTSAITKLQMVQYKDILQSNGLFQFFHLLTLTFKIF